MKICVILDDDEAGYLAKLLKVRYGKSKKTALSTLLLLAAQEMAEQEMKEQMVVDKLEDSWGSLSTELE